jgi:hypothetical protein
MILVLDLTLFRVNALYLLQLFVSVHPLGG